MGVGDKISTAAKDVKGKAKEAMGDLTDDEKLHVEGKQDRAEAEARRAAEKAKEMAKDAVDRNR